MKYFIIVIGVLLVMSMTVAYAQQFDSQSVSSHYSQYSPNNIDNSSSHYSQYSPNNINNPYSQYEVQYSPKSVGNLSPQQEHDYHVGIVSGAAKNKGPQKAKGATPTLSLFDNMESNKNIPVFVYLLILSFLAAGLTIFVIIGIFKK